MDQGLSAYTYTITFRNEPLQNVLTGLEKITPIKYQINNGIVEVRKLEIRKKSTRNFIIKRVNAK
jgi:hypothetical protein